MDSTPNKSWEPQKTGANTLCWDPSATAPETRALPAAVSRRAVWRCHGPIAMLHIQGRPFSTEPELGTGLGVGTRQHIDVPAVFYKQRLQVGQQETNQRAVSWRCQTNIGRPNEPPALNATTSSKVRISCLPHRWAMGISLYLESDQYRYSACVANENQGGERRSDRNQGLIGALHTLEPSQIPFIRGRPAWQEAMENLLLEEALTSEGCPIRRPGQGGTSDQ